MTGPEAAGPGAAGLADVAGLAAASGAAFGTSGVRGLVTALTPEVCDAYAQAFLALLEGDAPRRVLLGRDLRPSSEAIAGACHRAAWARGWLTEDAGVLPTPALAHAGRSLGLPAIMVTGSHIPFDRNGIKFFRPAGEITKEDERRILAFPLARRVPPPHGTLPAPLPSAAADLYVARYLNAVPPDALKGLRVGVYEHSSAARDMLHVLLRAFGADTVGLGRSDGFVAVDTEAVSEEDRALARGFVSEHALDALVTTDGDADRPLVADEAGAWIRGDILGLACARELGAATVVTPVSSNTALEASGLFRQIIRTRIGSPHVIAGMERAPAAPVVGYEANGGVLLGSSAALSHGVLAPLPTRDAVLPILLVLAAARRLGRLSAVFAGLPERHTFSDRVQGIDATGCRALLDEIAQDLPQVPALLAPDGGGLALLDCTDGLRATFASGDIVHLRLSGNAPELRCYAESAAEARAMALCRAALSRAAARLAGARS